MKTNAEPSPLRGNAKRVLGIEGGGTKTEWILADCAEGAAPRIIRQGMLPSANLKLNTDEELTEIFFVLPQEATHVGAFLAGCRTPEDHERLRAAVAGVWPKAEIVVGSDRDSAMAVAFGEGDGVIVIAGTGAVVHGRRDGRTERAGGWGQLLGDRGSGYDVAMRGLRSVLTHCDLNDEVSPMAQEILRTLALNRLNDLIDWVPQADKMSIARLAPAVFAAARRGDPEMGIVVREGAEILAGFAHAVAQRLEFEAPPVRLFGGLFAHQPEYAELFCERLALLSPKAEVQVSHESGAFGAVWLAGCRDSASAATAPRSVASVPKAAADHGELAAAATEQSNPRSAGLDALETPDLVSLFIDEEHHVAEALSACRNSLVRAVDITAAALHDGGRLFYVGAGTSGRLGVLDASEIPPTFGASSELVQGIIAGGATALHHAVEGAEDEPEAGSCAASERGVRAGDVVCGLTASGRTPFVLGALARSRALKAHTLLITCNPARLPSPEPWDVEIDLPTGPEIVTGSTRLKAGTATKVALNILSTSVMIRLGKVRGNRMVDVRISNEKLRDRGIRLVGETLGISYEEAGRRLAAAGWNVRACLEYGK
jgi:N-acetylmuramic acid 6-phosphate etherase